MRTELDAIAVLVMLLCSTAWLFFALRLFAECRRTGRFVVSLINLALLLIPPLLVISHNSDLSMLLVLMGSVGCVGAIVNYLALRLTKV